MTTNRVTRAYIAWTNMIQRCTNPKRHNYYRYGGRGIKVCERWRSYDNFLADMGQAPDGLTLERNDSNEDYCPSNCRWAPAAEQSSNRPGFCKYAVINGVKMTAKQAWTSVGCAVGYSTFIYRISKLGMSIEEALAAPSRYSK